MIISCLNNKGGVGKTTVTINLSHALANREKRVLVVDQDPQCNSSASLLPSKMSPRSLHDLYSGARNDVRECIYHTQYDGVDILPNIPATASLEHVLYQDIPASYELARKITNQVNSDYDYIFFDCPPTLGIWVIQALIASDCSIVPVESGSKYAIDGLIAAVEMIQSVSRTANPSLRFLRLLMNKVDLRTSVSRTTVDFVQKRFGADMVFTTSIPENTHIQQAELAGKSVIRHNPQCVGSKRFRDLAEELIQITGV